jgi:hypothetical protein
LDHTAQRLLRLKDDAFRTQVDAELKGHAGDFVATALRSDAVRPRWILHLRRLLNAANGTIEARDAEAEADRLDAVANGDETLATDIERRHLRWRAGAVRFRTGVQERLLEATADRHARGIAD